MNHELGATPLFITSCNGHMDVVEYLCESGAANDHAGENCSQNGHVHAAKYLCENGAAKDHVAHDGATPLFMASCNGNMDVVKYLCDIGAAKDHATRDGAAPLFIASQNVHNATTCWMWFPHPQTCAQGNPSKHGLS